MNGASYWRDWQGMSPAAPPPPPPRGGLQPRPLTYLRFFTPPGPPAKAEEPVAGFFL